MVKIIVDILGSFFMIFIYWFFFMKREKIVEAGSSLDILVEGGYKPDIIEIKKNRLTKINFLRKDSSTCLEEVVLSAFKIRKFLPLNKRVTVEILPRKNGEYNFSCGMGMFHGKLIVKS